MTAQELACLHRAAPMWRRLWWLTKKPYWSVLLYFQPSRERRRYKRMNAAASQTALIKELQAVVAAFQSEDMGK